ncbi:putative F-box protein At3g17480 [Corylus avellana]|uniref:putative F-box protein At3g17480 n=1 Tax=Corylus avellana TaxID=13451 RepID=UPI00286D0E4B|nr:putative F-box protein At3g17480 [Corylus avellana]
MVMRTSYLPEDLLRDILLRLPVKHLVRLRLVCKSWSTLLKSRDFTTTRLNRSANHGGHLLVYRKRCTSHSLSLISVKALNVAVKIETPEKIGSPGKGMVVGSCNGLVCLYNGGRNITLWNPATGEDKILPPLGINPKSRANLNSVGFGYHLNDYKVVRILYSRGEPLDRPASTQVEVYSTSTGCWRVFDAIVPCFINNLNSSVILKGVPYWIGHSYNTFRYTYRECVIYFDMGKEVFQQMHTPPDAEGSYKKLGVWNESLALIRTQLVVSDCVDIWAMMKDDDGVDERWIKVTRINSPCPSFGMLLGCWGDGVLVWQNDHNYKLLVYDHNIKAVNKLSPDAGVDRTCSHISTCIFTYMESLVPL